MSEVGGMTEVGERDGVSMGGESRPKARLVGPVDTRRVVLGTAVVVAAVVGATIVVRALDDGGWSAVLALVLGVVVIPVIAAPIEWYVHRFVYHEPVVRPLGAIFRVHTAHHFAFFPTWRYVTDGPARRLSIRWRTPDVHASAVRNAGVRLAHFAWYLSFGVVVVWVPAWLVTRSVPFVVGLAIGSVVVSNLFIVVHDTIHRPGSHRLVEAQPWFAFLDRHHYIHHVDLGANLNFLLPLGDLLFGTLRTSLTDAELADHGDLESAKAVLVGSGERATQALGRA
jgi:hypothetical protein